MRPALRLPAIASGGLALFLAGVVCGQQGAPTDYQGVDETVLASVDLAKEIDSVRDRELRLSRASIRPGGHVGLHSHRGDPTIVYIVSGVLTNHHDDGSVQEFRAGDVFAEFGSRSHWVENRGSEPVSFIVANIHKRQ